MTEDYTVASVTDLERVAGELTGTENVDLTAALDCTRLAARVWFLSPGDAIAYHRETEQEELYYVLDGPGRLRVDDDVIDVPEGGAVRVSPETPRQVLNDTDEDEHIWLIVGAPGEEDEAEILDA